jgi:hypothetical protein
MGELVIMLYFSEWDINSTLRLIDFSYLLKKELYVLLTLVKQIQMVPQNKNTIVLPEILCNVLFDGVLFCLDAWLSWKIKTFVVCFTKFLKGELLRHF